MNASAVWVCGIQKPVTPRLAADGQVYYTMGTVGIVIALVMPRAVGSRKAFCLLLL